MSAADPIARFLDSLAHERKLAEHTLRGYAHELAELQKLAGERQLAALTPSDIRGSVVRAHSRDLSARSIAHRLSVWRSFYRWLGLHSEIAANPVSGIRAPKQSKTLPKALSAEQREKLCWGNAANLYGIDISVDLATG